MPQRGSIRSVTLNHAKECTFVEGDNNGMSIKRIGASSDEGAHSRDRDPSDSYTERGRSDPGPGAFTFGD